MRGFWRCTLETLVRCSGKYRSGYRYTVGRRGTACVFGRLRTLTVYSFVNAMTSHLLKSRRPTASLERSLNKGGGGSAPAAAAPIPPVSERGSEVQFAREDAMRAGQRKKGNRSTILGGAMGSAVQQVQDKAYGQRTLLGGASN